MRLSYVLAKGVSDAEDLAMSNSYSMLNLQFSVNRQILINKGGRFCHCRC